jgi:hypothetical protein
VRCVRFDRNWMEQHRFDAQRTKLTGREPTARQRRRQAVRLSERLGLGSRDWDDKAMRSIRLTRAQGATTWDIA